MKISLIEGDWLWTIFELAGFQELRTKYIRKTNI